MKSSFNLFKDHTAWFSTSVKDERKSLWMKYGGLVVPFESAQFVFSEDTSSEDTKQIYRSEAYRYENLAVFHAKYITDCVKDRKHQIPVGKYFLPPTEIQKAVRDQMEKIWTDVGKSWKTEMLAEKLNSRNTGQKYKQTDLFNEQADTPGLVSPKQGKDKVKCSDDETHSDIARSYSLRQRQPVDYNEVTNYDAREVLLETCKRDRIEPENQDYYDIDALPKVTSQLEDLVPGKNGFQVITS